MNWCLIIGVVILVCIIIYICMTRKSSYNKGAIDNAPADKIVEEPIRENFTSLAAGAIDNIGVLSDMDLIPSVDSQINTPAMNFADLVSEGGDHLQQYVSQPRSEGENLRPMDRLQRVQGKSMMPRCAKNVTPYNVDLANPVSYSFMVNVPRVTSALKNWLNPLDLHTALVGTVPINYNPNVALVATSQYGRFQAQNAPVFGLGMQALYDKYTGKEYKNLPMHVAGAGQACGYSGASGEIIMDA